MPTADGSAAGSTSLAGAGARGEAMLLASAGFGPAPAGQLFEGLLPLQPISPEAQAVVASILAPVQDQTDGEASTEPMAGQLPLLADEAELTDLPTDSAVTPEPDAPEGEGLAQVGELPTPPRPGKPTRRDELAGETVAASVLPVVTAPTETVPVESVAATPTEGAGEGPAGMAAATAPRARLAAADTPVANLPVAAASVTEGEAQPAVAAKPETGRPLFSDTLTASPARAEATAQPTAPVQSQPTPLAAPTQAAQTQPTPATTTPTAASPNAVETQVQRNGLTEATAGIQLPSAKRETEARGSSAAASATVANRAVAATAQAAAPTPVEEPEALVKSTADVAGLVDDSPAVALPQQVAGWKKILLNAYKQSVKTIEETVGIKDAKTDGIMPSVLSSPFIPAESVAPVAPGSAVLSSVPAEWAEKLADLTARAERLAPARLEVSLPMEGADDLRVRVSCRGGQVSCEFHNVSQELQRLFLREWPGLSQLFGKESQLRVEQPTFVNLTNPQDRPGGDQSNRRQRDEQAAREEDETIAAFFAAQRKPAGRAA